MAAQPARMSSIGLTYLIGAAILATGQLLHIFEKGWGQFLLDLQATPAHFGLLAILVASLVFGALLIVRGRVTHAMLIAAAIGTAFMAFYIGVVAVGFLLPMVYGAWSQRRAHDA